MQHKRQSPMRWYLWLPLLLLLPLGGLLVLEPQGPRAPAEYPIAQLVLALLMYGVVVLWLWGIRWALARKERKRGQKQVRAYSVGQQQQESVSTQEPWDDVWFPWKHNGPSTDRHRRR
ncbi:MAG TPA: hypothetical protein VIH59_09690 [Candidatus Tectomicrobia bacterium]|jgi:hypothetical protein